MKQTTEPDFKNLHSKENRARMRDIQVKIEWKTATFAEKNVYNIYMKRLKKQTKTNAGPGNSNRK